MNEMDKPGAGEAETLTRRQVLKTAAGLALLLPMAGAAFADAAPAPAGTWTAVGKAEDFVLDKPKRVTPAQDVVLYVTRQKPDKDKPETFVAVSARCTHRGCEVRRQDTDTQFHCPCHGAVFATGGKNVQGTRRAPDEHLPNLPTVPVRLKDGQVEVNLPAGPEDDLKPDNAH